jgi:hypothetical protein
MVAMRMMMMHSKGPRKFPCYRTHAQPLDSPVYSLSWRHRHPSGDSLVLHTHRTLVHPKCHGGEQIRAVGQVLVVFPNWTD